MTITEKINKKLKRIPAGVTFRYQDLQLTPSEYQAAAKYLERMVRKGELRRLSRGILYKPRSSAFGELRPSEDELIKPYLYEGKKRVAYLTGTALYNRMGLTTQVPNTIRLASSNKRINTRVGNLQIKPAKSYVKVSGRNYYLLELLDAIKDFNEIPDIDKKSALIILKKNVSTLQEKDKKALVKYATDYPSRVRALLGALLEELSLVELSAKLRATLNPLSEYKFGIDEQLMESATNWYIR